MQIAKRTLLDRTVDDKNVFCDSTLGAVEDNASTG
jgi:hypothetical protein